MQRGVIMNTLLLDTHLNDILVYLLEDGKVVDKVEVINKKNNSELLFPSVKKILDKYSIDEIIVITGPGYFTGVRLGVTIAKTLAYTLNIPIKCVTSLEASAVSNNAKKVAISDGNGYYIGEFQDGFTKAQEYYYVKKDSSFDLEQYNQNYKLDAEKVYEYMQNKKPTNCHNVNPIYIKKIGVEIDTPSQK